MNRSFYPKFDKRALDNQDADFFAGASAKKADKTWGLTLHTVLFGQADALWMFAVRDRYRELALPSQYLPGTRQRITLSVEELDLFNRRLRRIVGSFIPAVESSRSLPILAPYLDVALLGKWLALLFVPWTTELRQRPDLSLSALIQLALEKDAALREAIDVFLVISLAKIYILMLLLLKPQLPATMSDMDRQIRLHDIDEFCLVVRKGLVPFLKAPSHTNVDGVIRQFASLCEPNSIKAVAVSMYERVVQSSGTLKELFPPQPSAMVETALRRKKQPQKKPPRKVKNPAPLRKGKRA